MKKGNGLLFLFLTISLISLNSCDSSVINGTLKLTEEQAKNLSLEGYAAEGIKDFSCYVDTDAYRKVSTPDEFILAINDAIYDYYRVWDDETSTFTQELNKEGTVHVIEITKDLNLGYYTLTDEIKKYTNVVSDYASKYTSLKDYLYFFIIR